MQMPSNLRFGYVPAPLILLLPNIGVATCCATSVIDGGPFAPICDSGFLYHLVRLVYIFFRVALVLLWAAGSHSHLGTVPVRYLLMHWCQPQTSSIAVHHEHNKALECHNQRRSPDFTSFSSWASTHEIVSCLQRFEIWVNVKLRVEGIEECE